MGRVVRADGGVMVGGLVLVREAYLKQDAMRVMRWVRGGIDCVSNSLCVKIQISITHIG